MEAEVFPDLDIADSSFLTTLSGRSQCSKCGKSRKYYCYTCCLPIPATRDQTPTVRLPLPVDVIKHPNEVDGKSTAIQAATLAPEDITIYTYPTIPHYDSQKVVLVFPGDKSMTLEAFYASASNTARPNKGSADRKRKPEEENSRETEAKRTRSQTETETKTETETETETYDTPKELEDSKRNLEKEQDRKTNSEENSAILNDSPEQELASKEPINSEGTKDSDVTNNSEADLMGGQEKKSEDCLIERVVFIDSTWHQVHKIASDERLKALPRIELASRQTHFWRHQQGKPDTYLATVEAIYYFCRDFHELLRPDPYAGQYDNLLFYFKFMYNTIRSMYDGRKTIRAYSKEPGSQEKCKQLKKEAKI